MISVPYPWLSQKFWNNILVDFEVHVALRNIYGTHYSENMEIISQGICINSYTFL